jgi:thiamine-monophosphate kinase
MNEEEVINLFKSYLESKNDNFSKIGDDVSWIKFGKKKFIAKVDMLVAKTDVPKQMKYWQVARKAVVMCVSDFACKGVKPLAFMISLGLPKGIKRKEIADLAKGFKHAMGEFNLRFLGGDTNEANDLIVDCIMLGFTDKLVTRSGAKERDVVCVSGNFGYTYLGLRLLLSNKRPNLKIEREMVKKVLMPKPRLNLGLRLVREGLISSSIDSSDGLALSLYQLAEASNVSIKLDKIPVSKDVEIYCKKKGIDVVEAVFYGGEEYEVICTVKRGMLEKAIKVAKGIGEELIPIGIVEKEEPNVTLNGKLIERRGWRYSF